MYRHKYYIKMCNSCRKTLLTQLTEMWKLKQKNHNIFNV